jgi:apolipoprotein N-acyltransferase
MIRRAVLGVWDFVVGDDWRLALAAVAAIGLTALACAVGLNAWWLAPLVALVALRWTLRGANPASGDPRGGAASGARSAPLAAAQGKLTPRG